MIFLILTFFIVSPLIILYTAGYRYDRDTHRIKETGVITIDVQPNDATVHLNDIMLEQRLPIHLTNRAPGIYKLSIVRQGYLPWSIPIEVQSKQTTYITDISLYRDVLPTYEYPTPEGALSSFLSPDGRFIATILHANTNIYEVLLYDLNTSEETTIWRGTSDMIPSLTWSPYATLMALTVKRNRTFLTESIDASKRTDSTTYTISSTTTPDIQWTESRGDTLYLRDHTSIIALAGGTSNDIGTVSSSVPWFIDTSQNIWTLNEKGILMKNDVIVQTFDTPTYPLTIIGATSRYVLVQSSQTVQMLWLDSGDITSFATSHMFRLYAREATAGWIAWSPWEVYQIRDDGSHKLITRTNKPLHAVGRSDVHNSLIFVFDDSIAGFYPQFRTTQMLFENTNTAIQTLSVQKDSQYILFETAINGKNGIYKRAL
ncbi:MAG: hypothetical protein COU32_00025 [Candidatus Magasanikbacteria bacterium CG10_big_fil_rev_8_21_14_0_10_42_10]|uniref:PEGA domain-containing protein n=2 Tax=Candidatus Magasanikiibacteriota TaxID=1752731 RepID=A0A2H0TXD4_9BACT|nr:MAG: hypothetical protein COU32_00025 [Candidatus Magasanikbacteria bacterium CG10_big_fil_rev_8_21_14_0_10_42_10]PIZ93083.1 MAG: hypothetical protein COX82_03390 [Candidatus Magasanikbacteria bacterium CG_4_10_14_0_2_um_filter_41_10]